MNTPQRTAAAPPVLELPEAAAAPEAVADPETSKVRGPIFTNVLPSALVALDIEVREKYLSNDLPTVCEIARKSGSVVLIATAGFPIEKREASFAMWRKDGLQKLSVALPEISDFLSTNEPLRVEFESATIDLLHLDRLLHDVREEHTRQAHLLLKSRKEALRAALAKHTPDIIEGRFPKYCVVRGDGKMSLYHSRPTALEWAREGNFGYHFIPLSTVDRVSRLSE